MVLQLLLGGVSGVYVIFRLFNQKILRMLGIRTEPGLPATPPLNQSIPPENEDSHTRSA